MAASGHREIPTLAALGTGTFRFGLAVAVARRWLAAAAVQFELCLQLLNLLRECIDQLQQIHDQSVFLR